MFQSPPMPHLSHGPPQLLGQLLDLMQTLLQSGHDEAVANLTLVAVQCHAPPPTAHCCPFSFPPPSSPSPRRRRRQLQRRRSNSSSPGSTSSSSLSTDVDALITSIMELPVTSAIQTELDAEELAWNDNNVCTDEARDEP